MLISFFELKQTWMAYPVGKSSRFKEAISEPLCPQIKNGNTTSSVGASMDRQ